MWRDLKIWRKWATKPDITYLELLGVVTAAKLFGGEWSGKAVKIWCDNNGVCSIVSRKVACFRRRDLNDLMAEMCEVATKYRFYFWIEHIAGVENKIADALSRGLPLDKVMKEDFKEMKEVSAKTTAAGLMRTWTDNMDYVVGKRKENRRDC